jgi:alanine or glycine:cation symporter, AGCS family
MEAMNRFLATANAYLWHDYVLYVLLGTGVLFTVRSGFSQYRALTHGFNVIRGTYDHPDDPGAINHFQALSAALSATVGLGNIGGVALAIALGGPGAVFWMWVIGLFGMATKLVEVTLSMLYRNTDNPTNPHGGPMWVIAKGLERKGPGWAKLGRAIGVIFCITTLIMCMTGGNMFQAWNVGEVTQSYFGIPSIVCGAILVLVVGATILGGITRIGAIAGRLVPGMLTLYLISTLLVLVVNFERIPEMFTLIFRGAFGPIEASGAFIGGTFGYAFLFGMKRALFSSEAGMGSSPIAHSAAKTKEPVREGIVAGLEPFIDTIVVCTLTALVILSTGVWQRGAEALLPEATRFLQTEDGLWTLNTTTISSRTNGEWLSNQQVFVLYNGDANPGSGNNLHQLDGLTVADDSGRISVFWNTTASTTPPVLKDSDVYASYVGATLTAFALDTVIPGLGKWLITIAVWLFAVSTMISWSYYGEQAMVFLAGERSVLAYKFVFCALILVATAGLLRTDAELDNLSSFGSGVMLIANLPIMWIFGGQAIRAYKNYIRRLDNGEVGDNHEPPSLEDVISGKDVR